MQNLKIHFNHWNCPHCAASDFRFVKNGEFQCDYCNNSTNFYEVDKEVYLNKFLGKELKQFYKEKIDKLERNKAVHLAYVKQYSAKASQDKLGYLSFFCILLFIGLILNVFTYPVCALLSIPFLVAYILIKRYRKSKREQYQPLASYYASNVVKCDEELSAYTRLLSKFVLDD